MKLPDPSTNSDSKVTDVDTGSVPEFSKQRSIAAIVGGSQALYVIAFVLLEIVLAWFGEALNPLFSYDRQSIWAGQWWRVFSGNFFHLNMNHCVLNLATLVISCLLFRDLKFSLRWWLLVFIGCCFSVGLGLLLFDAQVSNYVGLSGALYGILACGFLLIAIEQKHNRWLYLIIYVYVCYKVISQQFSNFDKEYLAQYIDGDVIASSHLYGLLFGHIVVLGYCIQSQTKKARTNDNK